MDNLELEVRIIPLTKAGKTKAIATVTINDMFAVKNLRVIDGKNGLFVAMPSLKNSKGEYEDLFIPITKESRELLQETVLEAYEEELSPSHKHGPEMSM